MPADRGPARPAERLGALAALLCAGCGAGASMEESSPGGATPVGPHGVTSDPLNELAALGYTGWDEGPALPPAVTSSEADAFA